MVWQENSTELDSRHKGSLKMEREMIAYACWHGTIKSDVTTLCMVFSPSCKNHSKKKYVRFPRISKRKEVKSLYSCSCLLPFSTFYKQYETEIFYSIEFRFQVVCNIYENFHWFFFFCLDNIPSDRIQNIEHQNVGGTSVFFFPPKK